MVSSKLFFSLFFLLIINTSYSQNRSYGITTERNDDKSVTFSYYSNNPRSVLIILTFSQMSNASGHIIKKTVSGYGEEIHTLHPLRSSEHINFSYSYRTVFGNIDEKPNVDFKYIFPFKRGKKIEVRNLSFLGKKFGNSAPKNWKAFQFLAKPNDTILAIRKGIVVSAFGDEKSDKSTEFGFKSKSNYITIEHEDGTFAKYDVLRDNSIMVNVGDTVYPSAPIAIAGSYDLDKNSQLRLTVYYLDKKILNYDFSKRKNESLKNSTHLNSYIDPYFYNLDGSITKLKGNSIYSGTFNNSIIEFEMSKREKRKWKKKGLLIKKR